MIYAQDLPLGPGRDMRLAVNKLDFRRREILQRLAARGDDFRARHSGRPRRQGIDLRGFTSPRDRSHSKTVDHIRSAARALPVIA